jgi:hypothetical protein
VPPALVDSDLTWWARFGILGLVVAAAASLAAVLDRSELAISEPGARTLRAPVLVCGAATLLGFGALTVASAKLTFPFDSPLRFKVERSGWELLAPIVVPTVMLLGLAVAAWAPRRRMHALGAVAGLAVVGFGGALSMIGASESGFTTDVPGGIARLTMAIAIAIAAGAALVACVRVSRGRENPQGVATEPWLLLTCVAAAAAIAGGAFIEVAPDHVASLAHTNGWFVLQPFVAAGAIVAIAAVLLLLPSQRDAGLGGLLGVGIGAALIYLPFVGVLISIRVAARPSGSPAASS